MMQWRVKKYPQSPHASHIEGDHTRTYPPMSSHPLVPSRRVPRAHKSRTMVAAKAEGAPKAAATSAGAATARISRPHGPPPPATPTSDASGTSSNYAAATTIAWRSGALSTPSSSAHSTSAHPYGRWVLAASATTSTAVARSGRRVEGTSSRPQPANDTEAAAAAAAPTDAVGVRPRATRAGGEGGGALTTPAASQNAPAAPK